MTSQPQDFLIQAWKKQCDAGLSALEAIIEGATKIHETQLQAAAAAHADAEATRKAIAAATDPARLFQLQTEWARANAQNSFAYWRSIVQAVMETDAALVKCACAEAPVALPAAFKGADLEASRQALLGMVDSAYQQWLGAAQRFYRPAEKAA